MKVTLQDIADRSGLSTFTVSSVLGNRPYLFRPATRDRVLRAAQELGYRPNSAARAIATGKFGCVSLVMSTEPNRSSLFTGVLRGVHDELLTHDLHLNISWIPDRKLVDNTFVPKILRQTMADGLLLNYFQEIPPELIALINAHDLPAVWINTRQKADCVYPDDLDAGVRLTRRLIEAGHRDIGYVDFSVSPHYSRHDRLAGYTQAMREAGLVVRDFCPRQTIVDSQRFAAALQILRGEDRPTAFVAHSDSSAWAMISAAMSLGLQIPRDLSIVAFHGSRTSMGGFAVTTAVVPEWSVGQVGVQMLVKKMRSAKVKIAPQAVPFEIEEGVTVTSPAR